jgi:hypothetical protein
MQNEINKTAKVVVGYFILSILRHFLIPWSGGAFAPLGPFLCPTTEEK